eukprot:SRR837773.4452.p2 GENE.SRR837773.4452~~SRR837773.4452.p2  ORF type:complete len:182 (-),score=35.18 SRR837773.4452:34-522(-)
MDSPRNTSGDSARGARGASLCDSARRSEGSKVSTSERRQRRMSAPSISTMVPDSQPLWKSGGSTGTGNGSGGNQSPRSAESSPRSGLPAGRRASVDAGALRAPPPRGRRGSVVREDVAASLPLSPLREYMAKAAEPPPLEEKKKKSGTGMGLLQGLKGGRKK